MGANRYLHSVPTRRSSDLAHLHAAVVQFEPHRHRNAVQRTGEIRLEGENGRIVHRPLYYAAFLPRSHCAVPERGYSHPNLCSRKNNKISVISNQIPTDSAAMPEQRSEEHTSELQSLR